MYLPDSTYTRSSSQAQPEYFSEHNGGTVQQVLHELCAHEDSSIEPELLTSQVPAPISEKTSDIIPGLEKWGWSNQMS